jgi:hypothetical protein
MHGGLQLALTRLFETPDPSRFHQLTSLTLRDFLEPHGTPTKRLNSRVRLCKVSISCANFLSVYSVPYCPENPGLKCPILVILLLSSMHIPFRALAYIVF